MPRLPSGHPPGLNCGGIGQDCGSNGVGCHPGHEARRTFPPFGYETAPGIGASRERGSTAAQCASFDPRSPIDTLRGYGSGVFARRAVLATLAAAPEACVFSLVGRSLLLLFPARLRAPEAGVFPSSLSRSFLAPFLLSPKTRARALARGDGLPPLASGHPPGLNCRGIRQDCGSNAVGCRPGQESGADISPVRVRNGAWNRGSA